MLSGAESEDDDIVFLERSGFERVDFEGLSPAGDGGAVGGVEIDQHEGELGSEVDAGVGLADGVVVQLVLVVLVAAEEELPLLLQEQLINRLLILDHDQGDYSPPLLVCLHSLIAHPPVPVTPISHLVADSHQDLAESVVTLPLHHSPVLLDLSAFLEAVDESSGMRFCQFAIQFLVPLKLVPQQLLHHPVLPVSPIAGVRNCQGELLEFLVGIHLIQGLSQRLVVRSRGLIGYGGGGVEDAVKGHPSGVVVVEVLIDAVEVVDRDGIFGLLRLGVCAHATQLRLLQRTIGLQYQLIDGSMYEQLEEPRRFRASVRRGAHGHSGAVGESVPDAVVQHSADEDKAEAMCGLCSANPTQRHLGVRFEFAGFEEFELKSKLLINETARWEVGHLLQFKATLYEMRQKFITISIVDDQNKPFGSLKINLYLLATGPYHQDFSVPLPKAPGARISFNLKIAQNVKIRIRLNEVKLIPKNKEFPGDMFAFGMRSIIGDKAEENGLSYKFQVELEDKDVRSSIGKSSHEQRVGETNNNIQAVFLKKQVSHKTIAIHHDIQWSRTHSSEMPEVEAVVPLYDLHGASFNIVFYLFNHNKHEFHSECFLSFNKLSNEVAKDERKESLTNITYEVRDPRVQLKTWDHGKQSGLAIFQLVFELQSHVKQMQVCVRTENGILESSPVFGESAGGALPEELSELERLGNEIQNLFIEATKSTRKRHSSTDRENWIEEINIRLKKQKEILSSSAKESRMMFVYQDEKSLLKGQRGLIELGFRTRSVINEDNESITPYCWELLIALMKRGELTLAFMGFKDNEIEDCLAGRESQFLKRKKEVSMSYHALMIDFLHTTLQSLETYTYESQREFAELFCAYAYFRIPKFRSEVLAAITRADDPEIEEWRGTEFSLNEESIPQNNNQEGKSAFSLMFDWENHFYRVIEKEEKYTKTEGKLVEMFRYNGWEERMRKRGGAFFAFIRFWVSYVENIAVNSKHVMWRYFPGYNKILQSFLVEMKSRSVPEYSESMRKAAASMLSNQKLLNPFVLILFKKTNSNDQVAVVKSFDLIHLFFNSIQNRGRSLPTTFDLKFLLKGMKNILEGEAVFSIGKVLLLLYDHYKLFPVDFRIQACLFLMSKVFFKLFLNWSGNVRAIFHHLLFIRIYHESSRPLQQLDLKDQDMYRANPEYRTEIVSRYRKLLLILENAQEFEHKIRREKINVYEKETFKKMRSKILKKRRQIAPTPSNSTASDKQIPAFATQDEYERQLMVQLSHTKLEKYSSEVLTKNLKVAVEHSKSNKKEEVIVHTTTRNSNHEPSTRKRKLSFFQSVFQDELVPLREAQVVYVRPALEEYHKISENFIQHVEKNKDSVPVVKLELSLDEKELRPEGLSEHEEW